MATEQLPLGEEERGRLDFELLTWLEGGEAATLLPPIGEPGEPTARVAVYLESEPSEDELPALEALGLESLGDSPVLSGQVTRAQLLGLARHPRVVRVEPVRTSHPFGEGQG